MTAKRKRTPLRDHLRRTRGVASTPIERKLLTAIDESLTTMLEVYLNGPATGMTMEEYSDVLWTSGFLAMMASHVLAPGLARRRASLAATRMCGATLVGAELELEEFLADLELLLKAP